MTEPELTGIVDPDVPAPPQETAAEPPAATETPVQPDDEPDAVEVAPGHRVVPVGVVKALREELRQLKPQAERVQQLEAYVNDSRPYVEFLKANPGLLQPRQEPAAPAPSNEPDPSLVELARTLELYDASTGQPDVKRAKVIRDMTRQEAQVIADQAIAPVQATTYEARAAQNLQSLLQVKDANGTPLSQDAIMQAVKPITSNLTRTEALRILADPQVTSLIELTALGIQAKSKKAAPAPPAAPPLHVESPGGGSAITMSEDSRKLLRGTKISEKDYLESAKRFRPNAANVLE